ncbi:MAG: alpha/beta hydrolase [Thermoleophilaceae bacterium]
MLGVRRWGPRDAPAVLALHGITANSGSWQAVARALGDSVRLSAPDLRGRADSAGLQGPYGIERHAADALAVLDAEGLSRAVVAGHSMGAYVAARLAADHPDRVQALVLVDGGLALPVPTDADPDEVLKATLGPALERLSMTFSDHAAHRAFWREHPAFAGDEVADEDLAAWVDHDLGGEAPELRSRVRAEAVRTDGRDLVADEDTRTALDRVTTPGVLLRAQRGLMDDDNAFIPIDQAEAFSHRYVELREVAEANHYTMLLGPEGVRATAGVIRETAAAG